MMSNLNPLGAVDAKTNIIDNKNITTFAVEVLIACLTNNGAWTQVSRLGMPLANEIIIGRPDKNLFNASEPKDNGQYFNWSLKAIPRGHCNLPKPTGPYRKNP